MKKAFSQLKRTLSTLNDKRLHRELLGQDQYGNKFYQYYSPKGYPTQRKVIF